MKQAATSASTGPPAQSADEGAICYFGRAPGFANSAASASGDIDSLYPPFEPDFARRDAATASPSKAPNFGGGTASASPSKADCHFSF